VRIPEKIGEEVAWRSPYGQEVNRVNFLFPDGKVEDYYVREARTPALAVALTEEEKILFTRQWRPGAEGPVLEIPGGCPKKGVSEKELLRQELREETGYEPTQLRKVGDFFLDPPSSRVTLAVYLATGCHKVGELKLDATEVLEVVELSIEELASELWGSDPKNCDAKTLAALFLVVPFLSPTIREEFLWVFRRAAK
jgi:8-oxo-dGTP pyrophosphatase MutT (NUDIX family)